MKRIFVLAILLLSFTSNYATPMKSRVIQPLFSKTEAGLQDSFDWTLAALKKCDESLDIIVLPEFSEAPGSTPTPEKFFKVCHANGPELLKQCAATAKRCNALVFVGATDFSGEKPRNATFIYGRDGQLIGKFYKQHLTESEWLKRDFDRSYSQKWTRPTMFEIEGLKYAFLTCYDFYFYEAYANIARYKPDIIIGCSHQRSDPSDVLNMINSFCAYHTGAYLVRASVSMGEDSPVGGCSCVVSPSGKILCNLVSKVGIADMQFDPSEKYLKPAGYGNPPALHCDYIEKGRNPWLYRPGGSAIVNPFRDAPAKRLCAHRGFSKVLPENSLAAFGAAVGMGASEIEFDIWWTADGELVSIHDKTLDRVSDGTGRVYEKSYSELLKLDFGSKKGEHFKGLKIIRFEDILQHFSCHTIMNIHLKSIDGKPWDEKLLKKLLELIDAYDCRKYVYFMSNNGALQEQLAALAPDIPRCMGNKVGEDIVERAVKHRCQMVQLFKPYFDQSTIDRAHAAGMRCNVFYADDPEEALKYLEMGVDTILTNDYQIISDATSLK